jgi:hypothetical protein
MRIQVNQNDELYNMQYFNIFLNAENLISKKKYWSLDLKVVFIPL